MGNSSVDRPDGTLSLIVSAQIVNYDPGVPLSHAQYVSEARSMWGQFARNAYGGGTSPADLNRMIPYYYQEVPWVCVTGCS